jgi:two-component system sensor histidine kinase VicK
LAYLGVYLVLVVPILIALYMLLINRNAISVTSSVILVVIITLVLALPVAYVFLNQVSAIDDDLQKVNQKLAIALGAGKFGSYELDLATSLMECSNQCKANFGLSASADLNFPDLLNAIRPEFRDYVQQQVGAAIAANTLYEASYQISWPDGSLHWISVSGMPQYDQNGAATSIIGITYDITEQKENDLRKNAFIGMVSHEMKTPLTSVKAYVQMLRQRAEKAGQDFELQALGKADQQLVKMTRMINGFLNVSRLESGQILLDRSTFDLSELIREITDETTLTLTSHEITFALNEITLSADRDKIGQVINNLITNGIKYSPGRKVIRITATADEHAATVRISDSGMGVASADLDKVFERFYRSGEAHHQHISGFGIGLYLSAEIIRLHKGKIWAESTVGAGSDFYFSLPL